MGFIIAPLVLVFSVSAVPEVLSTPTPPPNKDVSLVASTTKFHQNYTTDLALNCSFNKDNTRDFDVLMSLALSKTDDVKDNNYKEIALVSQANHQNGIVNYNLGATVKAERFLNGNSFISYTWSNPPGSAAGKYRCTATGLDSLGHVITSSGLVTLEDTTVDLNTALHNLQMCQDKQVEVSTFVNSTVYNNHKYLVSIPKPLNISSFDAICVEQGGYLAEIDDEGELKAVDEFLMDTAVIGPFKDIMVGGTDEGTEGHWTYYHSGRPVTYTKWSGGSPLNDSRYNCLWIQTSSMKGFMGMKAFVCTDIQTYRFVCEIP